MDADDDDTSTGSIFSTYPFSWIIVPLVIFVGAGTLLVCYRYRRRRKMRMQYGTNALNRDLEAMGNQSRPRLPNERRAGGRRGLILMFGSREEGLNELGEAPPAYTAPRKRPEDTEGVELTPVEPSTSTTSTTAVEGTGTGTSTLPTYEDLQRDPSRPQHVAPTSSSNLPEPPPPAHLGAN
ncbi:hypothetical protein F4820DRAFT_357851 [Hypoxylon rubiginosum]|uniref:Uncharacterized protein n=1 Tax=Hypoxylon rubiginosum TaxID=110542 RepID=A0ACB9YWM4_9PEZI|nr:hypothetical protein F4820DRAFT_357851 [Hypoxylon rubiginosum]